MKITKKILQENKIYNSYDLSQLSQSNISIDYIPADNGRLTASYARWRVVNIKTFRPYTYGYKDFTVTCRENKQPKLKEVIAWVKEKYGLDCSEKDPFGSYQVVGTMAKIQEKIAEKK
jgi:hypothetical protein